MGIRIHKMIGYGLIDVRCTDGRITDPRINTSSRLFRAENSVLPEYLEYVERAEEAKEEFGDGWAEAQMLRNQMESVGGFNWPSFWDSEFGDPSVLLLRPVAFPEWHRYDNPIDYSEEIALHRATGSRVRLLPAGIYPFTGCLMDARTGRDFEQRMANTFRQVLSRREAGNKDREKFLKLAAKALGFDSIAEAERCVVPTVPGDIRRLAAWGELFTSPDGWKDLRPLLYVYWS